jgi:hypothetical protein
LRLRGSMAARTDFVHYPLAIVRLLAIDNRLDT